MVKVQYMLPKCIGKFWSGSTYHSVQGDDVADNELNVSFSDWTRKPVKGGKGVEPYTDSITRAAIVLCLKRKDFLNAKSPYYIKESVKRDIGCLSIGFSYDTDTKRLSYEDVEVINKC